MEVAIRTGLLALAAGIAISGAALATGFAQGKIGSAAAGTIAEKPELAGLMIVLLAIPETMVILGFAVAAMLILQMK